MTWKELWAALAKIKGKDNKPLYPFTSGFKLYMEYMAPGLSDLDTSDLSLVGADLSEQYADWSAAPIYPDAMGNWWRQDSIGKATPYDMPTTPAGPTEAPTKNTTDQYTWNGYKWEQNPWYSKIDTMTPYQQSQLDLQKQQLSQDWSAQQTAQQNLNWGKAQSQIDSTYAEQQAAIPAITAGTEPVNWIKNWQESQAADQARLNQGRRQAATQWYSQNMTPEQIEQLRATNPTNQQLWDYGYMGDPNYNIAGQGFKLGQFTEQGAVAGQAAQAFEQANTNPASNQSYIYALQTGIPGAAQQVQAAQASWNVAKQQAIDADLAQYNTPTTTAGPMNPYWTKPFNVPTQGNLLDVKALGNTWLAPVSASTYQGMAPSEQQGLSGLVGASRWGKYSGGSPEDYWANTQNMWQASRPGQRATRRQSWGY